MTDFLRQIPDGQQYRFDLTAGREYRGEGYARGSLTAYYLQADGQIAQCLIITNVFAHEHEVITAYYNSCQRDQTLLPLKDNVERLLGLKLDDQPTAQLTF